MFGNRLGRWASVLMLLAGPAQGVPAAEPRLGEQADRLFEAGKFAEAEVIYTRLAAGNPSGHVLERLGRIALLSNRLTHARTWLEQALQADPRSTAATAILAEVYRRQDDFPRAAPLLRAVGNSAQADQLASFGARSPYRVDGTLARTAVAFVMTDPLPVVRGQINGSAPAHFLIDTGGAEVILDPEFARQVQAQTFGSVSGTFAGGKQADVLEGRIDSMTLGDFTIRDVPVSILDTRRFAPMFGGTRIDGIIGTVLLYHFVPTLDYPSGKLVLARRSESRDGTPAQPPEGVITVPFWMGGDHYMVAWGRVEQSEPVLLFIDTGLAGGGVMLADSVLKEAKIELEEKQASEGMGGGGKVRVVPFRVKELALGKAVERNVRGLATAFPLEHALGFRIGGLISHGFFRPYAVTLDFPRMRLLLRRSTASGAIRPADEPGRGRSVAAAEPRAPGVQSAAAQPGEAGLPARAAPWAAARRAVEEESAVGRTAPARRGDRSAEQAVP